MSDQELNKCKKCNSLHGGNGECCGICQDKRIAELELYVEDLGGSLEN